MKDLLKCCNQIIFRILLLAFIVLPLIQSCKCNRDRVGGREAKNQVAPIHIQRFEKDLFSLNVDSLDKGIKALGKEYGEFFSMFNRIVELGSVKSPAYSSHLKGFLMNSYMMMDYKKVQEVYPDIRWLEADFQKAFENYKSFFPEKRVPRIFTYMSGWSNMIVTSDTIMAISLDMFLGSDCDYYTRLEFPKYQRYTMQKDYIVPMAMQEWGMTEFSFSDSAANLLSTMLYQGKVMYFTKKMVPEANDTVIFGFRPDQIKWCRNNEKQMWTYLLEHKLLFSTDYQTILKLTGPAPFTYYFTNESPGRAAVWLGYRIIKAYMDENDEVSLKQLMTDTDYQKILRTSNYRP